MATAKLILDIVGKDSGASSMLSKLGVAADGSVNKMQMLNQASRAAGIGLLAMGAAAVMSVKAAAEESAEQARLAQTLAAATGATAEQATATDEMLTTMGLATGVADDELRPALSKLAIATGDLGDSQELLSVALDASVALGKDVETVAVGLGKAYTGNVGALGRLGIATKDSSGEALEFSEILADLKSKTEGAAAAAGDAAPWARLEVAVGEAQEQIGGALLPAVSAASTAMAKMGPGAMAAGFAVTGVGLAALYTIPKVFELKKVINESVAAQKALAVSGKAAGIAVASLVPAVVLGELTDWNKVEEGIYSAGEALEVTRAQWGMFGSVSDNVIKTEDAFASLWNNTLGTILPDMDSHSQAAAEALAEVDGQLASLVGDGNLAQASKGFYDITAAERAQGATTEELLNDFPAYAAALEEARTQNGQLAIEVDKTNEFLDKQASRVDAASAAWQRFIGLPLDAAAAQRENRAATKSLIETMKNEESTRLDVGDAIDAKLRAMEAEREANIENGMAAGRANKIYEQQRQRLIEVAKQLGVTKAEIQKLVGTLGRIKPAYNTTVTVEVDVEGTARVPGTNKPVPAFASGGYAAAANGIRVGEHGIELLRLTSSGGRVMSHSQSMNSDNGGITVNIHGALDPMAVGRQVDNVMAKYRRGTARSGLASA